MHRNKISYLLSFQDSFFGLTLKRFLIFVVKTVPACILVQAVLDKIGDLWLNKKPFKNYSNKRSEMIIKLQCEFMRSKL